MFTDQIEMLKSHGLFKKFKTYHENQQEIDGGNECTWGPVPAR